MATSTNLTKSEEVALEVISRGTHKFAIDLYRTLCDGHSGNVFVSPLSAQIVLAQAYLGAKGTTATELSRLLSLPEIQDDTLTGYSVLIKLIQDPVLKLANRMFVDTSANIKEDFQKNIEKYFLTSAKLMDFKGSPDESRKQINTWVEEQTNKRITNLLAPNTVSPDTRLVLTNAIHFKAAWARVFPEGNTQEQPFHVSKSKSVPVQMMNAKAHYPYFHDRSLGLKCIGIDYEGCNFQMVILLPDEIDGLKKLEDKLADINLAETFKALTRRVEVKLALPKFKMEETMVLNDNLKALGAQAMFRDSVADFSGITDSENLTVSLVVQKSFVEVNEQGTEAAAATGFVSRVRSMPPEPKEFFADHPFMFLIMHQDVILFLGRLASPL